MARGIRLITPLVRGGCFIAYLKWAQDKKEAKATVERQLQSMMSYLQEGCLGHIAEIYDGGGLIDHKVVLLKLGA